MKEYEGSRKSEISFFMSLQLAAARMLSASKPFFFSNANSLLKPSPEDETSMSLLDKKIFDSLRAKTREK